MKRNIIYILSLMCIGALINSCREKNNEEVMPTMSLTAKINGQPWNASVFTVEQRPKNQFQEESLHIEASTPDISLSLPIYNLNGPGTYTTLYEPPKDGVRLSSTSTGLFAYESTATVIITKIEGNFYEGNFTATCKDPDKQQIANITEGSFKVYVGYCDANGVCFAKK
jgi:hypothetical protein